MAAREHKLLVGEGAGRWLPFARQKAELLYRRSQASGGAPLSQRWRLGGQFDVSVRVIGEDKYIRITGGCPPFLSGLCDLVLHKEGDIVGAEIPLTPVYQVPDPNDPSTTIDVFRRFYPAPATKPAERAWRDEPGLAHDQDAAKRMITLKASMFSGEMRKVVQVLQGMNEVVPYSPSFATTHGVYKAANGQRWIIEISNQGVVAWPMTTCHGPIRNAAGEEVLDYTPLSTPKPAEGLTTLATAGDVQPFYNQLPFFLGCGWAFSYDGHEAANVVHQFDGVYIYASLWRISLSETDDGLVASVSLLERGKLHGPRGLAHMKYPSFNGQLTSFDTDYGQNNYIGVTYAPVYVFYSDNARRTFYYNYDPEAASTTVHADTLIDIANTQCLPFDLMGSTRKTGTETHTPRPWFTAVDIPPTPAYSISEPLVTTQITGEPEPMGVMYRDITLGASAANDILRDVAYLSADRQLGGGVENFYSTLVVPAYEREAVYYCNQRYVSVSATTGISLFTAVTPHCGFTPIVGSICSGAVLTTEVTGVNGGTCIEDPCGEGFWVGTGPYGSDTLGQHTYFPGLSVGSAFTAETAQSAGLPCVKVGSIVPPARTLTTYTIPGSSTTTNSVLYIGSGGIVRNLAATDAQMSDWLFYILPGVDQRVVSIRDAFEPDRLIISPAINRVSGANAESTLADYPVSEAGYIYNLETISKRQNCPIIAVS